MDDEMYIDVRNRMQSLLARPDVEALMTSSQESVNQAAAKDNSSGAAAEESKTAPVSGTTASTVTVK